MEQQIITVNASTWRIEDGGVRFFVLEGKDKAVIIDTGMKCPEARTIAESLTSKPLSLLLTHSDMDHTSGNRAFDTVTLGAGECAAYGTKHPEQKLIPVFAGDVIDLGGRTLTVYDLAGHTPGSVGYLDSQTKALISGDPIQKNGQIFMFGEHRNLYAYAATLKRLLEHKEDFVEIWPSHADFPIDAAVIPGLIKDAEAITAGQFTGKEISMHGHTAFAAKGTDNILLINKPE